MTVPGLEGKKWDPNVWAWVDEGPAPAPAPPPPPPAPPGEPVGNPPPKQSDQMDCGKLKEMSEKDYADSPAMDCHPMGVRGGGTLPGHTQPDCMCYAWTSNCPYEVCQASQTWEGTYCVDKKIQKEFSVNAISKWSPMSGALSLCGYWTSKAPVLHNPLPVPAIDGAKWKTTQGLLIFQGLTLAGCYDATSAGNYEATKKGLTDKLGLAGVDIMYMICAQGGATPEWKFLQVGERTERWKGRAPNATVPGAMALLQYGRQVVPCVFNPGSPGCPTQPPVMFPYTPTATLSVEISALPDVVGKAQKENEDGAFCFKTPSELQPDVCTEWKSGEPCCAVAPVTEPPSVPEPAM